MVVFSSSGLASCGGGDDRVSEVQPGGPGIGSTAPAARTDATTEPAITTTATTTTTATATATITTAVDPSTATLQEPTPTTPATRTTEVGPAEDGEVARVPAAFAIARGGVTPGRISVPAFLTIAISARSDDGRAHTLRIATPKGPITLHVPPGGTASKDVEGLPDGEYLVAIDGQSTDGALVVGGEPRP